MKWLISVSFDFTTTKNMHNSLLCDISLVSCM